MSRRTDSSAAPITDHGWELEARLRLFRRIHDWQEDSTAKPPIRESDDPFASDRKPIKFWLFIEFDSHLTHEGEFQFADPGDGYLVVLDGRSDDILEFKYRGGEGELTSWAVGFTDQAEARSYLSEFAKAYGLDATKAIDKTRADHPRTR